MGVLISNKLNDQTVEIHSPKLYEIIVFKNTPLSYANAIYVYLNEIIINPKRGITWLVGR